MSENIPSTSAAGNSNLSPKRPIRKNRRKYAKVKLPTPPPDPRMEKKETCTENEFLEYLEHLQKHTANYSRSTSTLASALVAEDAFDHLERLYKLMEQMLELRSQNAKLHRKIRDLEHVNNLEKMYKHVENLGGDETCPELDKDTAFAETILESILSEPKQTIKTKGSLRQSLMRKPRNRSSSAIDKPIGLESLEAIDHRRASLSVSTPKKASKVSKWTKVKAAFKWEKASQTVGDAKSLDSGISGIAPVEIARYLRVPSNDDPGHSPSDSGAAEISTPGTLSSASSNENFHKAGHRYPYEEFRSSDDEHSNVYSSHSKEDPNISPRSSQRSHRTPWARMKDIINTRNPVRKKSRMSTHSDDIQIDIELCSDNEDVFEDHNKSLAISHSNATSCGKLDSENEIPQEIRERYKNNDENFMETELNGCRRISKWTKVKKAFLPNFDVNLDPSDCKDELDKNSKDPIQSEINRNYRHLQKKLSIEFQEKLTEWKKIKQATSTNPIPTCSTNPEENSSTKNVAFMKKIEEWEKIKAQPIKSRSSIQMTSQENLPPEFKKKLQEWEKIKKLSVRKSTKKTDTPRWKSVQTAKSVECPAPHIEIPVISEEFKKKLDEWKQIKATGYKIDENDKKSVGDKTPSPKLHRLDSKSVKQQQDKELQWYEKELNKIEKEKGRLERERQKFMEREEKLTKLRKSVSGAYKKDILVHTPCGSYKFEGISRKFTQKLYEWEKSRGIGPESSTFAFLNPNYSKCTIPKVKINGEDHSPPLTRSRSVDSVAISTVGCPLVSQPSSLSLNDVDELERKCLGESKYTSLDFLPYHCPETDVDEPEALIVEVEDFVEETAAPLKSFIKQHNPVYQREEVRALCEGETCLAPKIRRSESARAQTNYNLIEEILNLSRHISENEIEIRKTHITNQEDGLTRIKELLDQQKLLVGKLNEKLQKLQDENSIVVLNLTKENQENQSNRIIDILEVVQDLSIEIVSLAEKLDAKISNQIKEETALVLFDDLPAQEIIDEIKNKLLELRRHLSYVCAASDSTTPAKRRLCRMKPIICEKLSNESQGTSDFSQSSEKSPKISGIYTKNETKNNNSQSQGAIKKRIRYRVENIRKKSFEDSDEEDLERNDVKKYPKFLRSRAISDSSFKSNEDNEDIENKNPYIFPVVSKSTFSDSSARINPSDSPVTIFVKTTRKLFTPFIEKSMKESLENEEKIEEKPEPHKIVDDSNDKVIKNSDSSNQNSEVAGLPPLPLSPTPQKKYPKDISPNIRLMLNKYHQKISDQDSTHRSGNSSGSASPVAWRSPIAERRVKAQTEKYQEEIEKLSPLSCRRDIKKSASQGYINILQNRQISLELTINENKGNPVCRKKSVLKSNSAANLIQRKTEGTDQKNEQNLENLKFHNDQKELTLKDSSELRLQKLKKAKEDFLNSGPSPLSPTDNNPGEIQFPKRNRLSQISVGSSSSTSSISPGLLIKSVSAGMINIEEEAYKQFEEKNHRGYVSLPRDAKPGTSKKSAISNIASKFRKVKMRRGKEKEKFPVVSELCRQSLVVDINEANLQRNECNSEFESRRNVTANESSLQISKSTSWIRRSNFFKK